MTLHHVLKMAAALH